MKTIRWVSRYIPRRIITTFFAQGKHIQDARDEDTNMMIEFYSFSNMEIESLIRLKVLDIGGRGLAAALLANFSQKYVSSSTLAGQNNKSIFCYTDFSSPNFNLEDSIEAFDIIFCPETYHLLHSGRYEGTYKNLSAQSNFLSYIGACSKFGTKLIVSVPINLRSSFNLFHNIYTP